MSKTKLNIPVEAFKREELSELDANAYLDFRETFIRDGDPEYIPSEREQRLQSLKNKNPYVEDRNYLIRKDDAIIATGMVVIMNEDHPAYEQNKHMAFLYVDVHPNYRKNGLARALLKNMVNDFEEFSRPTIIVETTNTTGMLVAEHYGGTVALESAENRLYMDEVDWDMVQSWVEEGPTRAPGVTLEEFTSVPEEIADEYLAVYAETMNQQPLGELDFQHRETLESRRVREKRLNDLGIILTTLISREPDGAISGLTEIMFNTKATHRASQELTGVKQEYRGRGLGKWLKAELLLRHKQRYPTIKHISTGNADNNAPMLSINERLGYKRYKTEKTFKFDSTDLINKIKQI